jgi:hypothetical protein
MVLGLHDRADAQGHPSGNGTGRRVLGHETLICGKVQGFVGHAIDRFGPGADQSHLMAQRYDE